jgi:hypothetical protein
MNPSFETILNLAFGLLFVAAITWLVSVFLLTRILKGKYPETYRALGEPGFHMYGDGTHLQFVPFLPLIRFILKREHHSLNDAALSRLCDFMRILFITYCLGFGALLIYSLTSILG